MRDLRLAIGNLRSTTLAVTCCLLLAAAAGCQIVGVMANAVGPAPVQAAYTPAKTPLLVLAENYTDPSAAQLEAEQLERFVIQELKAHDVAPLADYEKVYELRAAQPKQYRALSIDQIGKLAGAAQVLYINLHLATTDVGQASEVFQGRGSALVRVVDVETGRTLWPMEGSDGVSVRHDSRLVRAGNGVDEASVRREVQRGLAQQIGKLFYRYTPDN